MAEAHPAIAVRPRRRRWALLAAALAVVATATALVAVLVPGSGRSPACGGSWRPAPGAAPWPCSFSDEFSGDSLDTAKWQVIRTLRVGFRTGPECYVDDPQHVRVAGGHLTLTATRGGYCPASRAPYESGMVTTQQRFGQTYGRFEIRARLPDRQGVQPALWLYPYPTTYGAWPRSGEIDIAEVFGQGDSTASPHLHYLGSTGAETHPGQACRVAGLAGGFHTYAVTWQPGAISFDYDGVACLRVTGWHPAAPQQAPAPFDRPFAVLLQLALGSRGDQVPTAATTFPQSMSVDWVRVWRRPAQ